MTEFDSLIAETLEYYQFFGCAYIAVGITAEDWDLDDETAEALYDAVMEKIA